MDVSSGVSPFSPFLTISLYRAGQYFSHPVFSVLCHVSVSWHFFMSPCMLSLRLFLGRPPFLLPETSSRSDFAQMWLCSRLKQWPNFCFPGKFQQDLRGPPSWCLHFGCGPTWFSLLPISTSPFLLNLVCSHLSSLRPNILNRTSSLV